MFWTSVQGDSSYAAFSILARPTSALTFLRAMPKCSSSIFNARPLPTLRQFRFDVAVLAGVIEYVSRVDSLIDWLHENFPCC